MTIAVTSGKGGTGKTTVAVNIAAMAGPIVQLVDCDVEEPNTDLFFETVTDGESDVCIPTPVVDEDRCNGCGICSTVCEFSAIALIGKIPLVFPELCHGCGGCALACPRNAITEAAYRIGTITEMHAGNVTITQGRLDVGRAMSTPIIRALRKRERKDSPVIIDTAPGTSCPVIASLVGVDHAVLVTEPTPFGLHDLKLAVATLRTLHVAFSVVVNRANIGDACIQEFCSQENIPIIAEIPNDRRIAEVSSRGQRIVEALPEFRGIFESILDTAFNANRSESKNEIVPTHKHWGDL